MHSARGRFRTRRFRIPHCGLTPRLQVTPAITGAQPGICYGGTKRGSGGRSTAESRGLGVWGRSRRHMLNIRLNKIHKNSTQQKIPATTVGDVPHVPLAIYATAREYPHKPDIAKNYSHCATSLPLIVRLTSPSTTSTNTSNATIYTLRHCTPDIIPRSHSYCLSLPLCLEWYNGSINSTGALRHDQTNRVYATYRPSATVE